MTCTCVFLDNFSPFALIARLLLVAFDAHNDAQKSMKSFVTFQTVKAITEISSGALLLLHKLEMEKKKKKKVVCRTFKALRYLQLHGHLKTNVAKITSCSSIVSSAGPFKMISASTSFVPSATPISTTVDPGWEYIMIIFLLLP
jgi:hypothetical protein